MTLDPVSAKKVQEALAEYEMDLINEHIKLVLQKAPEKKATITAAMITAVREIRDRLGVPEIKA